MAKVDRSILSANDQQMGDFGDPNKLESSISHLADAIDGNDNDITTLKTDNTSNKGRLTILESDVSTLETENTSNKSRISTNESNIAYNEGRLVELLRNEQKASEVVDARLGFPVLRDKLKSVDAQLADIGINVKKFGAVGDGVVDDTEAIQSAINSSDNILLPEGDYKISGILLNRDFLKLIGRGKARLLVTGNNSALLVSGNNCLIEGVEIYSNGTAFGNGKYGIETTGDYTVIKDCYIHDITYSAIFLNSKHNIVENVKAELCGWDCGSNFASAAYNKFINCTAIKTGRHGFSTDRGSKYIEFIQCYVEDVGNPSLAEGHTPYHFEYSDHGKVIDSKAVFTSSHPLVSQPDNGETHGGVRNEGSFNLLVDGLEVEFQSGFVPVTTQNFAWVHIDHSETANTKNYDERVMKVLNSRFVNDSSIISNAYLGKGKTELSQCFFRGKFSTLQASYYGLITMIEDCTFYGDPTVSFYQSQYLANTKIKNNIFRNVRYAFEGRMVDSFVSGNLFTDSYGSIRLKEDVNSGASKSKNNLIKENVFENLTIGIKVGWEGIQAEIIKNTFRGNFGTVASGDYGYYIWKDNVKADGVTYTTLYENTEAIDDNLKSGFDKAFQIPRFDGSPSGWLWMDSAGKLRIKTTYPASDTDGTVVGTQV